MKLSLCSPLFDLHKVLHSTDTLVATSAKESTTSLMAHVCCLLVRPEVLDTWTAHNDTALTPTTRHWLQSVLLEGGISATSVHELIANSGNAKGNDSSSINTASDALRGLEHLAVQTGENPPLSVVASADVDAADELAASVQACDGTGSALFNKLQNAYCGSPDDNSDSGSPSFLRQRVQQLNARFWPRSLNGAIFTAMIPS